MSKLVNNPELVQYFGEIWDCMIEDNKKGHTLDKYCMKIVYPVWTKLDQYDREFLIKNEVSYDNKRIMELMEEYRIIEGELNAESSDKNQQ